MISHVNSVVFDRVNEATVADPGTTNGATVSDDQQVADDASLMKQPSEVDRFPAMVSSKVVGSQLAPTATSQFMETPKEVPREEPKTFKKSLSTLSIEELAKILGDPNASARSVPVSERKHRRFQANEEGRARRQVVDTSLQVAVSQMILREHRDAVAEKTAMADEQVAEIARINRLAWELAEPKLTRRCGDEYRHRAEEEAQKFNLMDRQYDAEGPGMLRLRLRLGVRSCAGA